MTSIRQNLRKSLIEDKSINYRLCLKKERKIRNKEGKPLPCPIQHHHGDSDPMVMMDSAVQSTKSLIDLTKGDKDKFEFFSYPGMEHTSCDKGLMGFFFD